MGLSHKKKGEGSRNRTLRRILTRKAERKDSQAISQEERIINQARQKTASFFSMWGKLDYQASVQQVERQRERDYKEVGGSKYGVAVIEASETELGQNLNDSALDFASVPKICYRSVIEEKSEAPCRVASEEEILEEMGMHMLELDKEESEDLDYLE